MGRYVAGEAPAMDRLVEETIKGVGAEVEALAVPRLQGVVLGGGYGRGEGGVFDLPDGVQHLSNDLDFFAVTEKGVSGRDIRAIADALAPVSERWTAKLGIEVDFVVRTPWRMRHDQDRVMIQELMHGYFDVVGKKGEEMFVEIERRPASAFPWAEAARLLMNRGVGLVLAKCKMESVKCKVAGDVQEFVNRNINKCVLGAGDARLIVRGEYQWRVEDRAAALGDKLYSAAVAWKFRPRAESVCDWETARARWLEVVEEAMEAGRRTGALRRSLYQAARWVVRRRTLGNWRTFGQVAAARLLQALAEVVRTRTTLPASLRRDWEIFN